MTNVFDIEAVIDTLLGDFEDDSELYAGYAIAEVENSNGLDLDIAEYQYNIAYSEAMKAAMEMTEDALDSVAKMAREINEAIEEYEDIIEDLTQEIEDLEEQIKELS